MLALRNKPCQTPRVCCRSFCLWERWFLPACTWDMVGGLSDNSPPAARSSVPGHSGWWARCWGWRWGDFRRLRGSLVGEEALSQRHACVRAGACEGLLKEGPFLLIPEPTFLPRSPTPCQCAFNVEKARSGAVSLPTQ